MTETKANPENSTTPAGEAEPAPTEQATTAAPEITAQTSALDEGGSDGAPDENVPEAAQTAAATPEPSVTPSAEQHCCGLSWWQEALLVSCLFLIVLAVFFAPALFQDKLIYSGDFGSSDLLELNAPRRILAVQALRQGEIPLWEPRLSNGLPLLAEGQAGIFYPLSLPFYALFAPTLATNLTILGALFIAMLGSYWLARRYELQPLPSLLAALAYGLGGILIFRLRHVNMVQVIAWLPFNLAMLRAYWQTAKLRFLIGQILVMTCQILIGHPHLTYICWLTTYLYAILLCFEPGTSNPGTARLSWWKLMLHLVLGTILALILCAVQLLPTMELTSLTSRSQPYSWADLKDYPFQPNDLKRMLYPYSDGNPALGTYVRASEKEGVFWETTAYIGVLPLALALLSLPLIRRQIHVSMLWGLSCFFLIVSFGPQGYLYWLFWKLCPGYNLFRCPSRFLVPFCAFLAILAAIGCQRLYDMLARRQRKTAQIAVLAILIITLADLFHVSSQYHALVPSSWSEKPGSIAMLGANPGRVYTPTYCLSWQDLIGKEGWRNVTPRIAGHRALLNPDLAAIWDVQQHSDSNVLDGGLAIAPYRHLQMFQIQTLLSTLDENFSIELSPLVLEGLRHQGVTHLLTYLPPRGAKRNPMISEVKIYQDPAGNAPPLYICAIKDVLPKARLVAHMSQTPPPYMQAMLKMFSISGTTLCEPDLPQEYVGSVEIVKETNNTLTLDCQSDCEAALVIANTYHPGWRARIDDTPEIPVLKVNHAYQGIPLPAGHHRVTLRFHSPAFTLGWRVSLGTLLFALIGLGLFCIRRR